MEEKSGVEEPWSDAWLWLPGPGCPPSVLESGLAVAGVGLLQGGEPPCCCCRSLPLMEGCDYPRIQQRRESSAAPHLQPG